MNPPVTMAQGWLGRWAGGFQPLWLAAVLLPAMMFAGGAFWSWRQVEAEAEARLGRTVQMLQEHALRAFETQETVMLAAEQATRGMGWEDIASSQQVHEVLRALENRTGALSGIGLVRPDGWMVATAAQFPSEAVQVTDREYFRLNRAAALDGPPGEPTGSVIGEMVLSRTRDLPVFSMSRTRSGMTGVFAGVIVTAFEPEYFANFYTQVAESPGDAVLLFRLDGALLARAPPAPDWSMRISGSVLAVVASGALRPAVLTAQSPLDRVERLYAVRRLENYPVAIAYGLDLAAIRDAWSRQVAVLGAVCLLAAGLLLALTALAVAAARRQIEAEAARADAEARLHQSRRLEALGHLAAGVAHDFRNTVQAVQGGARLIQRALDSGEIARARGAAVLMAQAAGRGAALTDRMLAFGERERGGVARPIDPAVVVREACELLQPTFGTARRFRCELSEGLPALVRGDRAELEAAIVNLAVNARDATVADGEIAIAATVEEVPAQPPHPPGLAPGRYVRIAVADDGAGMDAVTLARATEAFFTTKPAGEGTGLGLATARAFAEQAGGALRIESTLGQGTTVTLWLPEAEGLAASAAAE